jgi:hypothetical protein
MKTATVTAPSAERVHALLIDMNGIEAQVRRIDGFLAHPIAKAHGDRLRSERSELIAQHVLVRDNWLVETIEVETRRRASAELERDELMPKLIEARARLDACPGFERGDVEYGLRCEVDRCRDIIASAHSAIIRARERVDDAKRRWK